MIRWKNLLSADETKSPLGALFCGDVADDEQRRAR
jgi:hypothetical protein